MSQILTVNTIKSKVTNVWCAMKHNGKVLNFLYCRYNGPRQQETSMWSQFMLWNSNDGDYFHYPQNIIHVPVLMNETAFSFVLESYHYFHDMW